MNGCTTIHFLFHKEKIEEKDIDKKYKEFINKSIEETFYNYAKKTPTFSQFLKRMGYDKLKANPSFCEISEENFKKHVSAVTKLSATEVVADTFGQDILKEIALNTENKNLKEKLEQEIDKENKHYEEKRIVI